MEQLIVSMNLSLDGVEAETSDEGNWLRIDEEVHRTINGLAAGRSPIAGSPCVHR